MRFFPQHACRETSPLVFLWFFRVLSVLVFFFAKGFWGRALILGLGGLVIEFLPEKLF